MKDTTRIDKYLANMGVCARRTVDALLLEKTVTINGNRVTESGIRLNPNTDVVKINGEEIKKPELVYFLLNKPKGYISTTYDERSRKNVVSLIKTNERVYPVGRLDRATTGLLILTNDGELTNHLTHPRNHVNKTYRLTISGNISDDQIEKVSNGIELEDGQTHPAEVKVLNREAKTSIIDMTIHEGRNRQIRRMCEAIGITLLALERIAIGSLTDKTLAPGKYRELTKSELRELQSNR
ncbi:MAG TPA: pseudouridine synthase [Patescibacteria group bacterium]|nr:pseudouridine synthase [Patescibacteria group bacterium]